MDLAVVAALAVGFGLLTLGGDLLVTGATGVSRRLGMTPAVVGATVVATATSAPELAVSIGAALHGDPGLALGNVVGSNIANVLLVLGVAALVAPWRVPPRVGAVDLPVCTAMTALLLVLALDGVIGRVDGIVLLAVFVGTTVLAVRSGGGTGEGESDPPSGDAAGSSAVGGIARVVLGTAALVAGAELLVFGAGTIARELGVSEVVVGLTVVAIGTSLPELAAAVSAGRAGHGELTVGNAIGSNVANIGFVLGLPAALVAPIPVPMTAMRQDAPLALLVVVALWGLARWRGGLGRRGGLVLVGGYVLYLMSLAVSGA